MSTDHWPWFLERWCEAYRHFWLSPKPYSGVIRGKRRICSRRAGGDDVWVAIGAGEGMETGVWYSGTSSKDGGVQFCSVWRSTSAQWNQGVFLPLVKVRDTTEIFVWSLFCFGRSLLRKSWIWVYGENCCFSLVSYNWLSRRPPDLLLYSNSPNLTSVAVSGSFSPNWFELHYIQA